MTLLPEEEERLKKRNRLRRLSPKKHKIANISGRSVKNLLSIIRAKAKRG